MTLACLFMGHKYTDSNRRLTGYAIKCAAALSWVPEMACDRCGRTETRDLIAPSAITKLVYPEHFKTDEAGFPISPSGERLPVKDEYSKWELGWKIRAA